MTDNMETDYRKIARGKRIMLYAAYLLIIITALVWETGRAEKGLVTEVGTIYLLQVTAVVASLASIPLALKGFNGVMDRISGKPFQKRLRIYNTISAIRIAVFFIVMEFSILLYYLINNDLGLYCALIGFICSLFCFPTATDVERAIGEEEE